MRAEPAIDAVIIPSGDAHQSEYVACCDERRSFISGFSGSAGTALVLQHSALLWTDGRYFLQAARQLSADWTLMKSGEPSVPTMEEWLLEHMSSGQRVGVDAELISGRSAHSLSCQLAAKGIDLVPLQTNFVDEIWTNRPAPSKSPIKIHPFELAGEDISTKLDRVREILRNAEADAAVFSCLDEVPLAPDIEIDLFKLSLTSFKKLLCFRLCGYITSAAMTSTTTPWSKVMLS